MLLTAQKLYLSYICQQKAAELCGREDCLALHQFVIRMRRETLGSKLPTENTGTSKRKEDQKKIKQQQRHPVCLLPKVDMTKWFFKRLNPN